MESVLSRAVRVLRTRLGLTQAELGRLIGKTPTTILRYESSRPPRDKALIQLRDFALARRERWIALLFDRAFELQVSGKTDEEVEADLGTTRFPLGNTGTRAVRANADFILGAEAVPGDPDQVIVDAPPRFPLGARNQRELSMMLALRDFLRLETEPSRLLEVLDVVLRPYLTDPEHKAEVAELIDDVAQNEAYQQEEDRKQMRLYEDPQQ